ncbi:hypothetical protein NS228_28755 [Methylobacterium indicum]|uniref:hypothetical protein n=1 Tax=Methylobacterium indicum TaxID=1775910 RepID=UPI000734F8BD|nr:hypothetical protein [Methylobacterium indicum]KTS14130.1 hypothetical protein NS229_28480 [Methylobacterium indicum]KTS16349.1 hypothetical protein NS228_28755 [Methylobacterium indicum]KTS42295.1 hypothetical protein NS230_28125 [Methylobacterium indicum]
MSADLREIMQFTVRRGPAGKAWMEARHRDRKFVLFQGKDGNWTLFERIGIEDPAPRQVAVRSRARPKAPVRPAPLRLQRELGALGLVEPGDLVVEAAKPGS